MSKFQFRRLRIARLAMLAASLAAAAIGLTALGAGSAVAQVSTSFNGILAVVWGDPRPGEAGGGMLHPDRAERRLASVADRGGAAGQPPFNFCKRVTVQGRANTSAALGLSTIVVDQITSAEPNNGAPVQPQAAVIGTRKVLFLLLKFNGDPQEPHTVSFYTQLTNPLAPVAATHTPTTINGFFNKVSWGQFKFVATVGGNTWLQLPGTKVHYAPCNNFGSGCTSANIDLIAQDGIPRRSTPASMWRPTTPSISF